jgi:hypothetical protein
VPGRPGYFYGLTDRGPNADAPDANKSEMVPNFAPEIGEFKLVKGEAELVKTVTLKGPKSLGGVKYSGRPPHDTTEVIDDVAGSVPPGVVSTQEPSAGREVTPGSRIRLTVSAKPAVAGLSSAESRA